MEKLTVSFQGHDLYVDGEPEDAKMISENLTRVIKDSYDLKPDWFYKAKARNTLGT